MPDPLPLTVVGDGAGCRVQQHTLLRRLVDRMQFGVQGPLTLVSGPAGSGKSSVVAQWASRWTGALVWLSLDEYVDQPSSAWLSDLAHSIRDAGVAAPEASTLQVSEEQQGAAALAVALAKALARHPRPVALVLEGAERLADPAEGLLLEKLVTQSDGVLRVVVVTRTDPAVPLYRHRLHGTLTEIRAADLSFTTEEAAELFSLAGLTPSVEQVSRAVGRTAGWAAGLRYLAIALSHSENVDAAIDNFGDDVDVAGYLMAEVLNAQGPRWRDLLLRTSVLGGLDPVQISAVVDGIDGETLVESLIEANAFVEPVEGQPDVYRYQPLFREFLRAQLAEEQPALAAELAQRVAALDHRPRKTVPSQRSSRSALLEPLTARETEVLTYLSQLLTTEEIAAAMFVSVNTVRTHVRNLLRKLEASRRNEAIRRAWALGLLDQEDQGEEIARRTVTWIRGE